MCIWFCYTHKRIEDNKHMLNNKILLSSLASSKIARALRMADKVVCMECNRQWSSFEGLV